MTHYYMFFFFFFNDTATTEIYTLSLHDALPIYLQGQIARWPLHTSGQLEKPAWPLQAVRHNRWGLPQNGNFMPPGRPGMPAVSLPIFSLEVSSALRTAALKAAATRSSSMSLSSASRLGSMVMRLTSCF